MKMNCDIIRDLLPLYAEHITSEATNALVEEHLAECEACRAELEQMEQPVPVRPEAQPDAPLRRIRAALQRRSIRAAIGSVLAALCALAMIFWMGTARVPATTEQAQFWTYNRKENGADICILEVQGEGVWLDMEGTFSWGKPQISVRAMRYRFPGVHRVLTALVGSDRFSVWVMVSRYPAADRGLRRPDPVLPRWTADRPLHRAGKPGRYLRLRLRYRPGIRHRL